MSNRPDTEGGGGLRAGALGTFDSVVMAVVGCGPAYAVAGIVPLVVATAGLAAPAVLLFCAIPMIGIALAFRHLGRLDVNAGASYSWVARSLHPLLGFLSGWAVLCSTTVFLVSATVPAGEATLSLVSPGPAHDTGLTVVIGVGWFLLMALVAARGSRFGTLARTTLGAVQLALLLLFAVAGLLADDKAAEFSFSWLGFGHFAGPDAFVAGALVAGVTYWGWDVTSNLSEETRDSRRTSGLGGLIGVTLTGAVFVLFTVSALGVLGPTAIADDPAGYLSALGQSIWPGWGGRLLALAVLLSTVSTLELALLSASRTLFAMGRDRTLPRIFGRTHPEWRTPWVATLTVAAVAVLLLVAALTAGSGAEFIASAVSGVGLHIAFYYALAGLAVVVVHRTVLFSSAGTLFFVGLWPLGGAVFMGWIFVESVPALNAQALGIGLGALALGLVPMSLTWFQGRSYYRPRPLVPLSGHPEHTEATDEFVAFDAFGGGAAARPASRGGSSGRDDVLSDF
ncbi:APC family permease [Streptomyces solicathayae]|uniref:APC family permease n=1 Tax=Streptomyces solicathayae TaxID=3081768 RepID=A0ABZ0LRC1_9ACTN|nr:APC family permease [Streptomyces sp. HUAS YS2]WOX21343.1 APC family permease [Streptomyces sp. HUAS YS2]